MAHCRVPIGVKYFVVCVISVWEMHEEAMAHGFWRRFGLDYGLWAVCFAIFVYFPSREDQPMAARL